MLRPADLTTAQYPLATKPSLGYEQQLWISTENYTDVGPLTILGANSGVASFAAPAAAQLAATPQPLMIMLDSDVLAANQLVVTVTGLDINNAAATYIAAAVPPGYAKDQGINFPSRTAFELVPQSAAGYCKTITGVAVVCDALWTNAVIRVLGVPDPAVNGKYVKIGTKVKLDLDPKVAMPTAVQDGRDRGAYIKAGEIDIGTCNITVKNPSSADGLDRYKGKRVTGLIKEIKEDILPTQNIYLCGLIMTPKYAVPEGQEPITLDGTGMFEKIGAIPAH